MPEGFCEIPLTRGQVAIVSASRYGHLMQWKWYACWMENTRSFYAMRQATIAPKKTRTLLMHRVILGLEFGDKRKGDHRNGDTLDNTDGNLRIATHLQNNVNSRLPSTNTSGFKGVQFYSSRKVRKYRAMIGLHGKTHSLGYHETAQQAHAAYCEAARRLHGEFARVS
jgi:hypothetical protein